jgi:hypothetical protein
MTNLYITFGFLAKTKKPLSNKSEIWKITIKIAVNVFTAYSTTSRAEAERNLMIRDTN